MGSSCAFWILDRINRMLRMAIYLVNPVNSVYVFVT